MVRVRLIHDRDSYEEYAEEHFFNHQLNALKKAEELDAVAKSENDNAGKTLFYTRVETIKTED